MLHHLAACKAHVAALRRAKSSKLVAGLPIIFININIALWPRTVARDDVPRQPAEHDCIFGGAALSWRSRGM